MRLISGLCSLAALLVGCASPPRGIKAVEGFSIDRYLGTWYEIARLDHSFERGLSQVTAEYSKRPEGSIAVVNRGFDAKANRWREVRGTARLVGPPDVASLKVTFFWPFWGSYHVIVLDSDYRYAMVTSSTRDYLWILSREKTLPPAVLSDLKTRAIQWGFAVDKLIYVNQ